jgi:hypothetical protein
MMLRIHRMLVYVCLFVCDCLTAIFGKRDLTCACIICYAHRFFFYLPLVHMYMIIYLCVYMCATHFFKLFDTVSSPEPSSCKHSTMVIRSLYRRYTEHKKPLGHLELQHFFHSSRTTITICDCGTNYSQSMTAVQ